MEHKQHPPDGFVICQRILQHYGGDAYYLEIEQQASYVMDNGHKTTYYDEWRDFIRAYSEWCEQNQIEPF